MERSIDESAAMLPRRKSSGLKSFLFRKYGFGHIFHVWQDRAKENSGEGGLVKCSSRASDCNSHEIFGGNRDNDSEEYGFLKKARKNSLGKTLGWIKYNFLSSVISNSGSSSSSGHNSSAGKQEESGAAEISQSGPDSGDLQETKSIDGFSRGAENLSDYEMEKSKEVDPCSHECVNRAAENNGILEEDQYSSMEIHGGKSYSDGEYGRISRRREFRRFPPPLPSLARTGNLPCHMPWMLLRSYSADGRLVLQEVRHRRHEFFRAERSNGRLTLQLVQHDEEKVRAHQAEMFSNAEANRIRTGDREDDDEEEPETNDENEDEDVAVSAEGNLDDGPGDEKPRPDAPESCFGSLDGGNGMVQCFSNRSVQIGSAIGIESPIGCCAPPKNSFFRVPFPTIRPILS